MKPIYKILHGWEKIEEGLYEELNSSQFKYTSPQGKEIICFREEMRLQYFFTKEEALQELTRLLTDSIQSAQKLLTQNYDRLERVHKKYNNNEQKTTETFNGSRPDIVFVSRDSENDDSYCCPELSIEEPTRIERGGEIIWKHKDLNSMTSLNPIMSKFLGLESGQCSKYIIFKVQ